jgi:peptide/nickel transport system substrate-binding protein
MRRLFCAAFILTLMLASCVSQPVPVAEPTNISPPIVPIHAPEIRFALIGEPQDLNVWELFDKSGASYTDYALQSEYWPRLYHLAPPGRTFEPLAADGMPSEVTQEGEFYVATVKLRTDLKWSDKSPFTAEDVAFTVNTALAFELDYDWSTFSSRKWLDHVEAVDPSTIKYYFKQKPNVGIWQYGVLQSPIVQKAFWESTVETAASLLPKDVLRIDVDKANNYVATVESNVARLEAENPGGQVDGDLKRMQDELNYARNNNKKLLDEYAAQVESAQKNLYDVKDDQEPMLGTWMPAGEENGVLINKVNPDFPFTKPNFDRAVYHIYDNDDAAINAFQNGEMDFILSPNDLIREVKDAKYSSSYSARFLVFNPLSPQLADPVLRIALSCMIDREVLAMDVLQNYATSLDSFLLSSQWHDPSLKDACAGMDKSSRIAYAVKVLKEAGYSWTQEPGVDSAGQNLLISNGEAFPKITLAVPSKEEDALRFAAAKYVAGQAQYLGIPFAVQEMSINDVVYAVYSSQKYDMALMGWRLSEYPAYLCQWIIGGGQKLYLDNSGRLKSTCDALEGESNLDRARQAFYQIEALLMSELPLIPLFTVTHADVYRGLSYPAPAANVINGWDGFYGAPSYAIPGP